MEMPKKRLPGSLESAATTLSTALPWSAPAHSTPSLKRKEHPGALALAPPPVARRGPTSCGQDPPVDIMTFRETHLVIPLRPELAESDGKIDKPKKVRFAKSPQEGEEIPVVKRRRKKRKTTPRPEGCLLEGSYITVFHQNANGIRARIKDGSFFEALDEHSPDLVILTEVKANRKVFLRYQGTSSQLEKRGYYYKAFHSSTKKGYAGVIVLSKIPFDHVEVGLEGENSGDGRLVIAHFAHFCVVGVYSPNSGKIDDLSTLPKRKRFDKFFHAKLAEIEKPYILVGDLNVVSSHDDVEGTLSHGRYTTHPGCTEVERKAFHNLVEDQNLVDWQKHCSVPGFTFTVSGCGNYKMRLDYILPQKCLVEWRAIRAFAHTHIMKSDHSGQLFKLDRGLFRRHVDPGTTVELFKELPLDGEVEQLSTLLHDIDRHEESQYLFLGIDDQESFNIETSDETPVPMVCASLSPYIKENQISKIDPEASGRVPWDCMLPSLTTAPLEHISEEVSDHEEHI